MQKRILSLIALSLLANTQVYAAAAGPYLGLMIGPATTSAGPQEVQVNDSTATVTATPNKNIFGTRIFGGNQVNNYFAFEGGLDLFSFIRYNTNHVDTCSTDVRVEGFDIVGKGILPFGPYFDVFAKAGAAFLYVSEGGGFSPTGTTECGKTTQNGRVKPTFTLGASATLNQNWVVDGSVTRISIGGIAGSINFLALGISYHFVDRYCGQFLCD